MFFLHPMRNKERWRGLAAGALLAGLIVGARAEEVRLVADINPTLTWGKSISLGDKIIFTNGDEAHGIELWVSNGQDGNQELLKDILPGVSGSRPEQLMPLGGKVAFVADDGVHGREWWVTDGTSAGTKLVVDSHEGPANGQSFFIASLGDKIIYGKGLYEELWVTRGTEESNQLLVVLATDNYYNPYITSLFNLNDRIVFTLERFYADGMQTYYYSNELWVSDGTIEGTRQLFKATDYPLDPTITHLTPMGDGVFFQLGSSDGASHWVNQGFDPGSNQKLDLGVGSFEANPPAWVNGRLMFVYKDDVYGSEFWISDLTAQGTHVLLDKNPGPSSSVNRFSSIAPMSGGAVLSFPTAEMWFTNGTQSGTHPIRTFDALDIEWVKRGSGDEERLFFTASDAAEGTGLWETRGSTATTRLVNDFADAEIENARLLELTESNGRLLMVVGDEHQGLELWHNDATQQLTRRLGPIWHGNKGSYPSNMRVLEDTLIFDASDGFPDEDYYKDEFYTAQGIPTSLREIEFATTYNIERIPAFNDMIFMARSGDLWRLTLDQLSAAQPDFHAGSIGNFGGSAEDSFIVSDEFIYFVLDYDRYVDIGGQLQHRDYYGISRSDGTQPGTEKLFDESPDEIAALAPSGRNLFFAEDLAGSPFRLRFWDDDEQTTRELALCNVQSRFHIRAVDGLVYFPNTDTETGEELWVSDGTVTGTRMVTDLNPQGSSYPAILGGLNGRAIFQAQTDAIGIGLWSTNGASTDTQLLGILDPILPEFHGVGAYPVGMDGHAIYFAYPVAQQQTWQLWHTDGTPEGTWKVESTLAPDDFFDIGFHHWRADNPYYGNGGGILNGVMYFSAHAHGFSRALWRTDGTPEGTYPFTHTVDGLRFWDVQKIQTGKHSVYFRAEHELYGTEPFQLILRNSVPETRWLGYD